MTIFERKNCAGNKKAPLADKGALCRLESGFMEWRSSSHPNRGPLSSDADGQSSFFSSSNLKSSFSLHL
jgi:hypothetical protein